MASAARSALHASLPPAGTGVRVFVPHLAVWGELNAFSLLAEEAQSARHLSRSAEGNFLPPPPAPSPLTSLLCEVTDVFSECAGSLRLARVFAC